jgi:hypothetical protein
MADPDTPRQHAGAGGAAEAAAGAATLPIRQAGGFTATVDAFAWEADPDPAARRMRLWFVSLLGPQQAVKAVWARLVKGGLATFSREALGDVHFCALAPEGPRSWRAFTAALPGASGHQLVLLPEAARHTASRDDFVLLPRTPEEAPLLHFRFLDRRVDLPLHAGWRDWFWQRAAHGRGGRARGRGHPGLPLRAAAGGARRRAVRRRRGRRPERGGGVRTCTSSSP